MYVLKSFLWHRDEIAPRAKTADWHRQNSRRVRVLAFASFLLSAPHSSRAHRSRRKTHLPASESLGGRGTRKGVTRDLRGPGACGLPGGHSFFERLLSGPVRSSELGQRPAECRHPSRFAFRRRHVRRRREESSGQRRAQRRVPCRARPARRFRKRCADTPRRAPRAPRASRAPGRVDRPVPFRD